jgi:hypothetical protein
MEMQTDSMLFTLYLLYTVHAVNTDLHVKIPNHVFQEIHGKRDDKSPSKKDAIIHISNKRPKWGKMKTFIEGI